MSVSVKLKGPGSHTGLWGQMSWERFAKQVLRDSGELNPNEEVVEIVADEKWIRFRVSKRDVE